ncbi:5-nucleotidase/2, 3-cyclic phosphodiesterase related esterase [Lactobacillus equicursoris DSM 19284 = JCM 14600 = CIP 110162]|uniref:5-nucleotidase 2,3-cyclic phosphodiesterase related esterase n=1 Tax=Lactobacillus equicursoris DSM 19284 = JCM 14600 = CIP 110162 TaxID=1293597 RepID=K0NXP4_9LACO|nr:metallophosphoesterase [Lactobacillus equicursoris]KRL03243.1 5-nucleotidase 2,3-cyclic phosphodiesterase related esterase [Lactobacillus equicursoris DSM 19284 = JCM 14600 = CIP 110162]CCK85931.1 5-nucleotidase/2, 3-cyclic phosphodiesterase related esterase [Lactobacillus equicursoris DSM 19284 = JCM 14600 = CIP 110162]
MDIFKYTKGIIDKAVGASKLHAVEKGGGELLDPMQKYLTVGEYHVDARDATPDDRPFTLTVYQDDQGVLHQALSPEDTEGLAAEYDRKFVPELKRFKAFRSRKTGRRYVVEDYLRRFVRDVKKEVREGDDSVNIGVITDTHFKNVDSLDFYGWNGLMHVREFSYLDDLDILDFKCHLGDWIDGSDAGLISESELMKLRDSFKSSKVPYLMIKGNHDENDKFDEHHDLKASFPEREFEKLMWPEMYQQRKLHYLSKQHGVAWFDKGHVRVISLNTSDIPYILDEKGQKKYDVKITLGIREDQVQELIEILQQSSGKQIVLMSHANPINRKGGNALKYNGRSLHELLVAFNQKEKGRMHSSKDVPPEFRLSNDFDFTKVQDAKIIAYFCGHRHVEDQYRINGIQYILFNCSALMGPSHQLTTKYNKNLNRKMDHQNEFAGYIVNVDLSRRRIKAFGYGAATRRRIFFI